MGSILIAVREPATGSFLMRALRSGGFSTWLTDSGEEALAFGLDGTFDLLVLDADLGDRNGLEVLRALRARGAPLPILALGGEGGDAVTLLEAGADDTLVQPFSLDELLARVRARLRRTGSVQPDVLTAAGVRLDLQTREVTVGGRPVELTARELRLLETLLLHADEVLSREHLLAHVWGYGVDPATHVVKVYVNALRKKLGADVIETVRGAGYRVRRHPPPEPAPVDSPAPR